MQWIRGYLGFQVQFLLRFLYFDSYFHFKSKVCIIPGLIGFLGLFINANLWRWLSTLYGYRVSIFLLRGNIWDTGSVTMFNIICSISKSTSGLWDFTVEVSSGYLPAHNTLKVLLPISNHLKIVSEEYFKFREFCFCFNEINHTKNKSMNEKTIKFADK